MRAAQEVMGDLAASGLTPAQLALVMELSAAVATEARPAIDRAAENKRAYDREYRKGHPRAVRTKSYERNDPPDGSPKENNLTPSLPPAEVSEPDGSSPQPRPWTLPAGVSLQVWTDLLANRKRKRLINTPTAWKGFLDDLARVASQTGIPPPQLIEHAAAKGWGSINVPDEDQGNGRRTNTLGRHQPSDGLSSTARAAISVFGPD